MAQNNEPNIVANNLEAQRRADALEASLRAGQQQEIAATADVAAEAIQQEAISVDRTQIAPELQMESKLTNHLDTVREQLSTSAAEQTTREAPRGTTLSAPIAAQLESRGSSPSPQIEKSILSDPLEFIASLLKKIESLILGKQDPQTDEELQQFAELNQPKKKTKRKKKSGYTKSAKKKSSPDTKTPLHEQVETTGFYNLDEALPAEEVVDLETALTKAPN